MVRDELYNYSPQEAEKDKRRDKKRRPRMQISGRSVLGLAQIIAARAKGSKLPKRKKK